MLLSHSWLTVENGGSNMKLIDNSVVDPRQFDTEDQEYDPLLREVSTRVSKCVGDDVVIRYTAIVYDPMTFEGRLGVYMRFGNTRLLFDTLLYPKDAQDACHSTEKWEAYTQKIAQSLCDELVGK